jgi:hypothetical protein
MNAFRLVGLACAVCAAIATTAVDPASSMAAAETPVPAFEFAVTAVPADVAPSGSAFALEALSSDAATLGDATVSSGPLLAARTKKERRAKAAEPDQQAHVLTAERARVLLQSLTLPGWGQSTLGGRTSSKVFLLAEAGVWGAFTAFRVQEQLRRDAFQRTARVLAGIDLRARDEEFRRIVGSYISSDEYNQLVVARDAANLYYNKPDSMRWYISQNELSGEDSWAWQDEGALLRYRGQRKDAQRARLRTSTALGLAVVNRVLSVIHAARSSSRMASAPSHSIRLEAAPASGSDPTAFRLGVRADF